MKKKTLLIKTADLCIRIHYKYPYIEQQCETWRVNEGYEPDIEVSVTDEEIEEVEISIPGLPEISSYIALYIESLDSERVNLATLGNVLKKRFSGFDTRNYKCSNMTQMMKKIGGFKVESENAPDGVHKVMYISLADKH